MPSQTRKRSYFSVAKSLVKRAKSAAAKAQSATRKAMVYGKEKAMRAHSIAAKVAVYGKEKATRAHSAYLYGKERATRAHSAAAKALAYGREKANMVLDTVEKLKMCKRMVENPASDAAKAFLLSMVDPELNNEANVDKNLRQLFIEASS
jgi:hypothetical protein